MSPRPMTLSGLALLAIGGILYMVWVLILLLWIALYNWQVDRYSADARLVGDVLMWSTALLSVAAPIAAAWLRRTGISVLNVLPLVGWAVVVPLTFVLQGIGPERLPDLVVLLPERLIEGLTYAVAQPVFLAPYLVGVLALSLLSGLYPRGPDWHSRGSIPSDE